MQPRSLKVLAVASALIATALALASPLGAAERNAYVVTNLVSDSAAVPAAAHDASLVNGWGLTASSSSPWWVADNGTDVSTLYNGNTGAKVPLTVAVDSLMTPGDHVLRIHVFVPGNPEPVASTYHLGIRAGRAQISTQIRLARTQTVLALAEMSDGSVRSDAASIVVTLGACVDELWSD